MITAGTGKGRPELSTIVYIPPLQCLNLVKSVSLMGDLSYRVLLTLET